jgi:hypothetical protein
MTYTWALVLPSGELTLLIMLLLDWFFGYHRAGSGCQSQYRHFTVPGFLDISPDEVSKTQIIETSVCRTAYYGERPFLLFLP